MSRRSKRPDRELGILKTALVAGALTATVAGTGLLAAAEPVSAPAAEAVPVTVVVPADQLPPSVDPALRARQLELQPIPQAVSPDIRPVTRTRSSR